MRLTSRGTDPEAAWRCESCGTAIPTELAFASMESLELLCAECLEANLKPCEDCGARIRASAYQHLPSGRVVCEPCAVGRLIPARNDGRSDPHGAG